MWVIRKMRQSIFAKYFTACISVIVISFVCLASVVMFSSIRYSNFQRQSLYEKDAAILAESFSSGLDVRQITNLIRTTSVVIDANIYVVDSNGEFVAAATRAGTSMDISHAARKIPASVMTTLKNKTSVSDIGRLGGFYTRSYMTQAVPVIDADTGEVDGAVLVSAQADNLAGYIAAIFRIFFLCLSVVALFAFVAIYFITHRMVRPLRQMSAAARSFAKGDFSIRVPVGDSDEMGQLAVAFNNMAQSLTSVEEMRRSFVANVSHELKTPMTSIAGFIDGILDGTIPPEKERYYLQLVSSEVKRLSRLVRSFLDIARIEAGELKIPPATFDVEETIRRVILGFEYAIDRKHLTVKGLDEDADRRVMVVADADLTHQIIYNLVDNAVKFSNDGGTLEINVVAHDGKVYVGVRNTGMGIPASELPYVFDRFYKTDKSRSRDRRGVGLGLYIVRTVLNMQGEDISVRSVEGEYCEFIFTLKPDYSLPQ